MTSTASPCTATTASGEPCRAFAGAGSRYCFWHDPAKAAERAEARRRGGLARQGRKLTVPEAGGPVQLRDIGGVLPLLDQTVRDVLQLENSVARARTIGYLVSVALKALELTEIDNRLTAVEKRLEAGT